MKPSNFPLTIVACVLFVFGISGIIMRARQEKQPQPTSEQKLNQFTTPIPLPAIFSQNDIVTISEDTNTTAIPAASHSLVVENKTFRISNITFHLSEQSQVTKIEQNGKSYVTSSSCYSDTKPFLNNNKVYRLLNNDMRTIYLKGNIDGNQQLIITYW